MGWSKDYGKSAKVNAEYAKVQGDVAKQEAANLAKLKTDAEAATQNANTATANTNAVIEDANTAASNADSAASEAIAQANHAKNEGDRAKAEADRLAGTDVSVLDNKVTNLSDSVNTKFGEVTTQLAQTTAEGAGYGVQEGLLVEPQTYPIRNMTAQMTEGVVYFEDGLRVKSPHVPIIPFDNSDPVLKRKDIVCINRNGQVVVVKGSNATGNPTIPNVPKDAILLATVTIKAGSTAIDTTTVQDNRVFKYNNNELTTLLQNAKSSNALSIRPSEGIITKMLNNAQTYVKNVDKFAYGAPTAFYPGTIFTDENGKFRMNCSTFGHLMQKGIPFENSKYGGLSRNIVDPNFNDIVPVTDDLFTYDFAKWAHDSGFGYVPDPEFKNVVAGDAIFFSWTSPSAQLPMHDASFMNLDHTSIFVESNPDGSFVVYEDGNLPNLTTYPASYRDQVKYCCRLPFTNIDLDIKNIVVDGNKRIVSTGKSLVNTYSVSEKLENHKWYTAVIKGTIQTQGCWFNIYSGASLLYRGKLHGIKENGLYTFHFCTGGLDLTANNITISLVADSEEAVPTSTRNCIVDWFVVTPGFSNSIKSFISNKTFYKPSPTFSFLDGFAGWYNIYRKDGLCFLDVKVSNPETIAAQALVNIGQITGITLKTNVHIPAQALQELTAAPSYASDVTAWVHTDSAPYRLRVRNGETANVRYLHLHCVLPIEE